MVNGSVANIFNTYFQGDVFNYINFRHDVKILDETFENYRLALHDCINNVASITSLDE